MSTSDSDYSIDWLASDEDEDNAERLSPQNVAEPLVPPTSLLREFPTICFHCGTSQRKRRRRRRSGSFEADADSPAALQMPAVSPVQGFKSVYAQQTLSQESQHHSSRKRQHSAVWDRLREKPQADTENEMFSQKCSELQSYIQPLSAILQGLRSGRYSERLSRFQESVAMDRIQRIMGVLQNPNMGGRFLSIIMTIEKMLRSWFPHIKPRLPQTDDSAAVKKLKHHHSSTSTSPPLPLVSLHSSTHLKWLHTSPICSLKTPASTLVPCVSSLKVTQDNAVSSSTDLRTRPLHRLVANAPLIHTSLPFKISSPCLERLLQAKESIIAPTPAGDGGHLQKGRFMC